MLADRRKRIKKTGASLLPVGGTVCPEAVLSEAGGFAECSRLVEPASAGDTTGYAPPLGTDPGRGSQAIISFPHLWHPFRMHSLFVSMIRWCRSFLAQPTGYRLASLWDGKPYSRRRRARKQEIDSLSFPLASRIACTLQRVTLDQKPATGRHHPSLLLPAFLLKVLRILMISSSS
jgi:hypothetical protein